MFSGRSRDVGFLNFGVASDFFFSCFLEAFLDVFCEVVVTGFFLCPSSGLLMSVTCSSGGESGGSAIGNGTLMKLSETSIVVSSMVVMISRSRNDFGLDAVGL